MPYRRRLRAGNHRVTLEVEREEPLGFVSCFVEYEIDGTVSPYIPATFDDPAEGGEVEIERVTRLHPITGERKVLSSSEWPFSDEEIGALEITFAETQLQDSGDEYDYEPYYDNEADDYIP
jgi:hypothetical protein